MKFKNNFNILNNLYWYVNTKKDFFRFIYSEGHLVDTVFDVHLVKKNAWVIVSDYEHMSIVYTLSTPFEPNL